LVVLGLPLAGTAAEIERPKILWDRPLEGDVYGSALAGDTVVLLSLQRGAHEWTIEGRRAESGELAWQKAAPGTSLGPEVGGSIIVSGRDGIHALDGATGKERWRFGRPVQETNAHDGALGGFSSPAILDGECLYAADFVPSPARKDAVGASTFYCLGPDDGKLRWSAAIPTGAIGPSLASSRDSVIVVREFGASAVDKATRQVRWSIDFNSTRAPAALATDAAYLPAHGLRAVSLKDGATIWERRGRRSRRSRSAPARPWAICGTFPNTPRRTSRSTRRVGGSYGSGSFRMRSGREPIPATGSTSSAGTATSTAWTAATARPAGSSPSASTTGRRRRWRGRDG
jgi:outer membrane protein assembly factor BamB